MRFFPNFLASLCTASVFFLVAACSPISSLTQPSSDAYKFVIGSEYTDKQLENSYMQQPIYPQVHGKLHADKNSSVGSTQTTHKNLQSFAPNLFVPQSYPTAKHLQKFAYDTDIPEQVVQAMQKYRVSKDNVSFLVNKVSKQDSSKISSTNISSQEQSSEAQAQTVIHNPIVSVGRNTSRVPASTLKLFTSFAALDTLGKDFSWQTQVYYRGFIYNKKLVGDLYIQGSGDPKLVREHIEELMTKVKDAGIHHITGDIILDNSIFAVPNAVIPRSTLSAHKPYTANADGLLLNFSTIVLTVNPTGRRYTAKVTHTPVTRGLNVASNVKLSRYRSCRNWQSRLKVSFTSSGLRMRGSYPKRCGKRTMTLRVANPAKFAQAVFAGNWHSIGGSLGGKVRFGTLPSIYVKSGNTPQWLTSQQSPNLASVITDINHFSNNVMTEQVFLSLPVYADEPNIQAEHYVIDKPFSSDYSKANQWMQLWWQNKFGTQLALPTLSRASGLCYDECKINPNTLSALLNFAYWQPEFTTFKNSLSIVGKTGSGRVYAPMLKGSPAVGNAYIKTGTLGNVASLAGYVQGQSGDMYAIVAIINATTPARARPVLASLLDYTSRL